MSVAAELAQAEESGLETRSVLGPGGNRVRVLESEKKKKGSVEVKRASAEQTRKMVSRLPDSAARSNRSVDSSCSSYSFSSGSSVKIRNSGRKLKQNGVMKPGKVVPDEGVNSQTLAPERSFYVKRCDWITPNSDPAYASFHDEEWGVPIHDDNKLFELLVLSQALAELSWPAILNQRDQFRKLFDCFDIESVAKFTEKRTLTLKAHGNFLLSEPKLRAIIENARQILKVQQEFGSFQNYFWSFVYHKPIKNSYRYARQVPVKTAKADAISKDLIRRGFRCVGPTVVYSFMQVAGIVNDHLVSCFRYQECECASNVKRDTEDKIEETDLAKVLENTCLHPV